MFLATTLFLFLAGAQAPAEGTKNSVENLEKEIRAFSASSKSDEEKRLSLLTQTSETVRELLKTDHETGVDHALLLLAHLGSMDPRNSVIGENLKAFPSEIDIFARIRKLENAGRLNKKSALDLRVSFAVSREESLHGNGGRK